MKKPNQHGYWKYRETNLSEWEPVKVIRDGSGALWFIRFNSIVGKVDDTLYSQWNGECQ